MQDTVPSGAESGVHGATAEEMAACTVAAGQTRVVFVGNGKPYQGQNLSLCVMATQEESADDGGSQSGLGTLEIGSSAPVKAEFDLKEGVLLNVPPTRFKLSVTNLNEPGDPALLVRTFYMGGPPKGRNTRSYELSLLMEQPNIRVPPFAESFIFEIMGNAPDYAALLSDSQTGETYAEARPNVLYHLSQRVRWVRFMNFPVSFGRLIFFLSI